MRNVAKTITDTKKIINEKYELTLSEITQLLNLASNDEQELEKLYTMMINAFEYGYAMGRRATIKEMKAKAKPKIVQMTVREYKKLLAEGKVESL